MATTKYRVLRKRPAPAAAAVSGSALPSPGGSGGPSSPSEAVEAEAFEVLYRDVEASSAAQAITLALADEAGAAGAYAAVPERHWTQHNVGREPRPDRVVLS